MSALLQVSSVCLSYSYLVASSFYPGVVAHFLGATAAVFGNARGGIKGAVAGAALNGILITFLPLLFLPFLGELGGAATTFSDTDFLAVGIVFGNAVKYMGLFGAILFIIIVGATSNFIKRSSKATAIVLT